MSPKVQLCLAIFACALVFSTYAKVPIAPSSGGVIINKCDALIDREFPEEIMCLDKPISDSAKGTGKETKEKNKPDERNYLDDAMATIVNNYGSKESADGKDAESQIASPYPQEDSSQGPIIINKGDAYIDQLVTAGNDINKGSFSNVDANSGYANKEGQSSKPPSGKTITFPH